MTVSPASVPVATLRADSLPLALGVLDSAAGLLACALFLARQRRARDWPLLFFGIAALLYGLRVVAQTNTASYVLPIPLLRWTVWTVTGFILLPFTLFVSEILLPDWKRIRGWVTAILLLQGLAFTLAHLRHAWIPAAEYVNNAVVLTAMPVLIVLMFMRTQARRGEVWLLRIGIAVFMFFAAYTNAVNLGLVRGNPGIEYIGFSFLLGCLGSIAVHRSLRTEEQLSAINRELEVAQRIQSRLLPANVVVPGILIAGHYQPVAWVAGDFYDVLTDERGGAGILIADVAGHGVPAALTASMVKIAGRAQQSHADDPAAVLRGVNKALYGNVDVQFVTAAYLFLDTVARRLRYSAAGHPPMLLWRAGSGDVERVEENNVFLGAFADIAYANRELSFATGDRCLLYTDGVVEAPNPRGEEFGTDRLDEFLRGNATLPLQVFCDSLADHLRQWCARPQSAEQHDDITIVLIEISPTEPA